MSIQQTYQKKTQLEHILLRPDTYVGSVEPATQSLFVLDLDSTHFTQRQVTFTPAMFKIFDEILVNAADNYRKDNSMNRLEVQINLNEGFISVLNNGKGIPVVIHKQYDIYVPELIFGHLLTGSNYNDNEKKVTGGRNGYGAKLANIFSKKFIVEANDGVNRTSFKMVWSNNMSEHGPAQVQKYKGKDFTKITFYPDFQKFKMENLNKDTVALLRKRVYDMAGVIGKNVVVKLNGEQLQIKSFGQYVNMYFDQEEPIKIFDKDSNNQHWEVIVSVSDSEFKQVSFVNSICTFRGGTHVNMLADQIVQRVQQQIKKKHKDLTIKPYQIKSHLWIFVNSLIENPAFDSQTKETLTTKPSQFGSTFNFSEKAIKEILKTGIIDHIVNEAKAKELNKMAKVTGGVKKAKITGIPKLQDANEAGSKHSQKCTLILTEGDSAKALAMAGLQVVGRDYFGVFPLKGKLLNVREASNKQIIQNQQIQNVMKIVGLQIGKSYEDLKSLRYGSIMIMSDQDSDGSHIKGLIINFIHHFWPDLIRNHNGFVRCFITPIIKSTKGESSNSFYCVQDYQAWLEQVGNTKGWKIKYYKGLGTSTDKQAQEYFSNIEKNKILFEYVDKQDDEAIDLCFNKKKAELRKEWLSKYDSGLVVDFKINTLRYVDFVNKQLIHFSNSDNMRSIPSVCDGFKPGQRKVLFACFKRNLKQQIKVAQLAGYVAEHSAYHHGEMSLAETIIGMAQGFVGSNNINMLEPIGQFGSRNQGGKEHASSRYIFTSLSRITRYIFPEADDHILEYEEDDGQLVQPKWYLPILPMVLVNGAEGIGTGWSTKVPQFSPRDICKSLLAKMSTGVFEEIHPHYKGFLGTISKNENNSNYTTFGKVQTHPTLRNTVNVTELPIRMWTRDFKTFLEEYLTDKQKQGTIQGFKEYHTKNRVNFQVQFCEGILDKWQDGIIRNFKLTSQLHFSNLVLFNTQGHIHRYQSPLEILEEFYPIRLLGYQKRKQYQLSKLLRDLQILSNKMRFIIEVIEETLIIRNVKKVVICESLLKKGYTKSSEFIKVKTTKVVGGAKIEEKLNEEQQEEQIDQKIGAKDYDYLLSMPLWSLSYQKVEQLRKQLEQKEKQTEELKGLSIQAIWKNDINQFLEVLEEIEAQQEEQRIKALANTGKNGDNKKQKKPRKKKPKNDTAPREKKTDKSLDNTTTQSKRIK